MAKNAEEMNSDASKIAPETPAEKPAADANATTPGAVPGSNDSSAYLRAVDGDRKAYGL